ncbi:PIG-L family deacetylase [Oerskovia flava]|uniref:PIG-L family deacetylase n=1 Tax=Oerskovia flava TaxID=2986422 RepID=UPI002240DB72|nr:PIG-L family deacetylase [Oerskovia sp. JB1-3-2]
MSADRADARDAVGHREFDHRDAGTPEEAWQESGRLDGAGSLDLDDVARLVVLAAHPDDETLGAGGLVARLAGRGVPVTVVVATDGEGSHPHSATRSPDQLAAVRRAELVTAVAHLAPRASVTFLGLPDGGLREHREALHDAVSAAVGTASAPATTLLCGPWRGDGHRDHRIAGEVLADVADRRGARLVEYPVWLWHWGDPTGDDVPWSRLRRLDLGADERAAKARAVAAHRSQHEPLSPAPGDEPVVGREMLRHFERDAELFVVPDDASGTPPDTRADSLARDFFDDFYTGRDDPWGFETRWYEERKRALTLAALPRPRFRSALEVGCSTGVLTAELARRCDRLVGVDIAAAPLEAARRRLDASDGGAVELLQLTTPGEWPPGRFDLVVLSEVGYYYGPADLEATLARVLRCLEPDGVVVACHWRHPVAQYPAGGDDVHTTLRAHPGLTTLARHEEEDFLLDVLVRPPAVSVARATGLV